MADSNQYRHDPSVELDDDDPMLELARIMGPQSFDRVAPQPPEEDFGIDLEQEMLGEFSAPVQADTSARDNYESNAEPDFDYSDSWPRAEQQADNAAAHRDRSGFEEFAEPVFPATQFDAPSATGGEPEMAPERIGTGDPLLDEMFSLDERDFAPADAEGQAHAREPETAGDAASRETIDADEELLEADLAALDLAFSEQDAAADSEPQDWGEPAGTVAADEEPAGDDLETTSFNEIKASFAGIEDMPGFAPESEYDDHPDDHAEAVFAAEESLQPDTGRDWDAYDEEADVDSGAGQVEDMELEPHFEAAEPGAGLWAESGGAPVDDGAPMADAGQVAEDDGDIPDFDEDAFLDQSFLDDELLADLDLDDSAPEPAVASAGTDTQWSSTPGNDAFDAAVDLDPTGYELADTVVASGGSDEELASAIEDTFDTWDEGAAAARPDYAASQAAYDVPEIETTDIDDGVVPVTGDLDIPDLESEVETSAVAALDDYDTGYEEAPESEEAIAAATSREPGTGGDFESYFAEEFSQMGFDLDEQESKSAEHFSEEAALAAVMRATQEIGRGNADTDHHEEATGAVSGQGEPAAGRKRQGLMIAAAVAGIAVLGAVGAFTLTSGGDNAGGEPAIVRADPEPVKVKPADPGGTQVPNADKKVYEQVAGAQTDTGPEQKELVTTGEEPIDVATAPVADAPADMTAPAGGMPKSEDRIDPALTDTGVQADEDIIAVAPRRVKTFVVQPDGTLVQRESPEPAKTAASETNTAPEPVAAAQDAVTEPASAEQDAGVPIPQARPDTGAADPSDVASAEPAPVAPEPETPVAKVEPQAAAQDTKPEPVVAPVPVKTTTIKAPAVPTTAPVVASRPANQPVNIVGRTGTANQAANTQAASADTAAGNSNTSPAWVQISSHTSRDLAQVSYRNDLKRYGNLISGRGVNIVAADVRGQTWYRVNIPAQSWSDAAGLCQKIKGAGGDCLPKR